MWEELVADPPICPMCLHQHQHTRPPNTQHEARQAEGYGVEG